MTYPFGGHVHPRGLGSSPLQHVEHMPQCLPIEAAANADTVLVGEIDLDLLSGNQGLCGDRILIRCNHTGIS